MARIFKTPFGAQGDTEQVPEAPQGDGSVSLTQGFGYDYEREYEDPAAKDIRREVMNGLFHDITEAIGDIQLSGIAKWDAAAAPYPAGALVWHDNAAWMSTAGNNSSEPGAGSWNTIDLSSSIRLSESIDQVPDAETVQEALVGIASNPWISRAIGEEIWLDDSNPAVGVPPTDNPGFRYIKLTAGENGSGDYNDGVLINENVSGSAPLIEATAEVNLPDSPFHGQAIRLLNTERRFVRAGGAGVAQNDQVQNITGDADFRSWDGPGSGIVLGQGAFSVGPEPGANNTDLITRSTSQGVRERLSFNASDSPGVRAGDETRTRNVGRTVYMRIL